ncbi:MAG: Bug family tripartite tricarboxylate transporter substrate binding protein [Rhodospirillaceae bacterium]
MTKSVRSGAVAGAIVAALVAVASSASADTAYPTKPIRLIVPFPPGGPNDVMARLVSDHLSKTWSQPVVVENKPGAGGNLAADFVSKSPGDGYTMMIGATGTMSVNKYLYKSLSYDPDRDLTPATMLAHSAIILTVGSQVKAQNVAELVALSKRNPGKTNYGHPGLGTSPQLVAAMFIQRAGIDVQAIPYRGTAAIVDALSKGEVEWQMDVMHSAIPLHKAGKVRALAVSSAERWPLFPEIPTMKEVGFPDIVASAWFCLAVQSGTPADVVKKIADEVGRGFKTAEAKQRLDNFGMLDISGTPEEAKKFVQNQAVVWRPIIESLGTKLE